MSRPSLPAGTLAARLSSASSTPEPSGLPWTSGARARAAQRAGQPPQRVVLQPNHQRTAAQVGSCRANHISFVIGVIGCTGVPVRHCSSIA